MLEFGGGVSFGLVKGGFYIWGSGIVELGVVVLFGGGSLVFVLYFVGYVVVV